MHKTITLATICTLALSFVLMPDARSEETVIAEGEKFRTLDKKGWNITPQDESWASHTYGGMWSSQGGLLGAPADSVDSVAVHAVTIPAAGKYRVWSRYQAPPYFNFMHRVEVRQSGKLLYSEVYGKKETRRQWSFGVESTQLWWPWGVDHDAAEAPPDKTVTLSAGPAELRLITVKMPEPAGDPMIDLIALTTDLTPNATGPPGTLFTTHAMAAGNLFMRYKNTTNGPAKLTLSRPLGHYQPLNYAAASTTIPAADVPAGEWSEWTNIAPFCMLVHDDGLGVSLPNASSYTVQVARDAAGNDLVGHMQIRGAATVAIPIDITWNRDAKVITAREHTDKLVQLATTWRTANGGHKPKELLYFGAADPAKLRDALGFNTALPEQYQHNPIDGFFAHAITKEEIQAVADQLGDRKKNLRVLSFADESTIAYEKAAALTRFAKKVFGPQVETGINYTPHFPIPQYYGEQATWIDIFKKGPDAMTMFWSEDFIFSVPQLPQTISWTYAVAQCAVKYNHQKIHMYILPHAPGQVPAFLRRNMVLSIGAGARYMNMFCVAPAHVFSENYVSWRYPDTFRVIHESIYDSAEAEPYQINGTRRPGRVAIVRSHATEANESKLVVNPQTEPFMNQCANAAGETVYNRQILCRTDQQLLYTSLRHAQYMVDIITEDDIVDGYLKGYDVVYFAGEWIDSRAVSRLADWVQAGGILYATAGAGHLDENGNRSAAMLTLLGLQDIATKKDVHILRTFLEMPLVRPIDTITLDGESEHIDAIAMRQELTPDRAQVIGKWADGAAAVTAHSHGEGKAITVGTLAGTSYIKSGLRRIPFARGGNKELYNPTDFSPAVAKLAWLGVAQSDIQRHAVCSNGLVEALLMDSDQGTLVTLVNWDNEKQPELTVNVRVAARPKSVRTVQGQKTIRGWSYKDGVLSFTTSLEWADYILIDQS